MRRSSQKSLRTDIKFPKGTFLETEKGYFYVLSSNRRYWIINRRVLDSWSPPRVVKVSESDPRIKSMRIVGKMKYRNGSLLYCQADGKMYLICDNKACHIQSPDVLDTIGAKRSDGVWVSLAEINLHEQGEPLT